MTETTGYPVIELKAAQRYLHARRQLAVPGRLPGNGALTGLDNGVVKKREASVALDDEATKAMVDELTKLAIQYPATVKAVSGSRNDFDAEAASVIAKRLQDAPVAAILDKDFWRYLAVHALFEVITWRIPDGGSQGWLNNFGVGPSLIRCYPYKSYLRGKLVNRISSLGYAWSEVDDVDFYDSHLFGRRTGAIPGMAAALNEVRASLATSQALRPYARRAVQARGVLLTEVLSPAEARTLL